MNQEQKQDTAQEPVDVAEDTGEFMDTGVLHEGRICIECGNDLAVQGYRMCSECQEELGHDAS